MFCFVYATVSNVRLLVNLKFTRLTWYTLSMNEHEYSPQEVEEPVDGFGLTKERRMQTVGTNVELILRRCERKNVQLRDLMLRSFKEREELNERLGDFAGRFYERLLALPDFDLADSNERTQAAEALRALYEEIISQQFLNMNNPIVEQHQQDIESRKKWHTAGFFSYELGEQHELVLHVPPMEESPRPQQLKDSLSELATVVEGDPEISEIRGSSLLLEHPVAKRLGFTIDNESDEGFNPNFRMSREEFLKRFGR